MRTTLRKNDLGWRAGYITCQAEFTRPGSGSSGLLYIPGGDVDLVRGGGDAGVLALAWSDWDGDDPGLPLSPHGSPAVTFHGPPRVQDLAARLREAGERYAARHISSAELASLQRFLEEAGRLERGLFAFIEY